jgi:hypothetical protein
VRDFWEVCEHTTGQICDFTTIRGIFDSPEEAWAKRDEFDALNHPANLEYTVQKSKWYREQ